MIAPCNAPCIGGGILLYPRQSQTVVLFQPCDFVIFLNQTEGRLKLRTERHSRVYQMGPHMFISTIIDLDLTTSPLPWSIPVASYLGPRFSSCYPTPHNQFFTQHPEEIFFDFFNRSITYIWRREHIGTAS